MNANVPQAFPKLNQICVLLFMFVPHGKMHWPCRHTLTYMLLELHDSARTAVSPGECLWGPKCVLMFGSDAPADSDALAY